MAQAVLFAVGGTLIDSVDLQRQAWQETLRRYGTKGVFQVTRAQVGMRADQLLSGFLSLDQVESQSSEMETCQHSLFKHKYMPHVEPFPQIRELFERLDLDGYRIGLASEHGVDLNVYTRLADIGDLVDRGISTDLRNGPQANTFAAAYERLNIREPEEVIAICDQVPEARAAGSIGIRSIGLLCGGSSEEKLRSAGCREIYQDASELLSQYDRSLLTEVEMY